MPVPIERRNEYERAYRASHKAQMRAYEKKYYLRNRERYLQRRKNWYKKNKEKHWGYYLKGLYGISLNDVKEMLKQQNNKCAICASPFTKTPNVDHNHKTGRNRGLLCKPCNNLLGYIERYDLLKNAFRYLEQYGDLPTEWKIVID